MDAAGENVVCLVDAAGGDVAGNVPVDLGDAGRGEVGHHPEGEDVVVGRHEG